MRDPLVLDALSDVLAQVVSRHGSVREDGATWLQADDVVSNHLGNCFTLTATIHPGEARDAARDVLDRLAMHGLGVHRKPPAAGNGLAARLVRLSDELGRASSQPTRVQAIADQMIVLAEEAAGRDAVVIPAHLLLDRSGLPDGVVSLCGRRRA